MSSSWIEWLGCLLVILAAVLPFGRFRSRVVLAFMSLVAAWLVGTAGALLIPALVGTAVLFGFSVLHPIWRRAGRAAAIGGALLSLLLCILFPPPRVPSLPGPHRIGTGTFELACGGATTPLVVQVWYPASPGAEGSPARWLSDEGLASTFLFHRLAQAPSRSIVGVPMLAQAAPFPVVFYEHSWMGNRLENIVQVEDLASRGFVVIAMDHPEQAARVRHSDHSITLGTLPGSPDFSSPESVAAFERTAAICLTQREWELGQIRQSLDRGDVPMLAHRLRLDRLGVFGFSFGGTTALHLCAHEPAFHAGVNEDGFFLSDMEPTGPFLFFDDDMPAWLLAPATEGETPEQTLIRESDRRIQRSLVDPRHERHILAGARHETFTDRLYLSPIPRLAKAGKLSVAEFRRQVTEPVGEFFMRELMR